MFLYEIRNKIDNKIYVGITNNTKRRWKEHVNRLKGQKHYKTHKNFVWDFDVNKLNKKYNEALNKKTHKGDC